jgi:RNA polymerase sigma-70 factor, ECF subfamily
VYQGINYGNLSLGREEPASNGLVLASQNGDRAAFQKLIQDYEKLVMRVALNVTGSADAAQDIYCRVFSDAFVSAHQLERADSVFIWFHRILARHCIEYCRRHPQVASTDCCDGDFTCRLRKAIGSLTPVERVIFQLKQYHGLKIRTLAEIFHATPEFIIKSLQNANAHLRRQSR